MIELRDILERLLQRRDLNESESGELLVALTDAAVAPAMSGALLAALRSKGITPAEVRGFAGAMRSLARRPRLPPGPPAVDIVGTAYGGPIADVSGVANTQDTWYFWAIVKKSTDTLEWYVKSATSSGWAYSKTGSATGAYGVTEVYMFLGKNNTYGEWSNGDHAGFRWWDASLTSDELLNESLSLAPRRLTNVEDVDSID